MKNLAFVLIIAIVFASSCKKSYTCTCTTNTVVGNATIVTTNVRIIPDATQQEAATICLYGEVYQQGGSQTTHCAL